MWIGVALALSATGVLPAELMVVNGLSQRTAQLALSGERLDAETALRWGLVDAVEG